MGVRWVLKNFFVVKARLFWLRFEVCSCFCMVFLALLARVLAWRSMLVCVTFNVAMRGICLCWLMLCGKRNLERRRHHAPYTFFYRCCGCVRGGVDLRYCFIIITGGSGWSCMDIVVRVFPVTSTLRMLLGSYGCSEVVVD